MDSLSDLSVFCEIVASGSFVGAAERLHMTPSGVSKKLSRFEARLGVRLMNRTTRSLALTEAGRDLYARGQDILSSVEEAEAQAQQVSLTPRGRLRVACSDAFAIHVLAPMLPTFAGRYPEVPITLIQGDGPLDILEERVDVAIRFARPKNAAFVAKRLIPDPWVVCASPAYLAQFGAPTAPADLLSHRCLTIHQRRQATDTWSFSPSEVANTTAEEIKIDGWFSGIGLVVKAAAVEGLGIARLATFLVKDELESGRLVRVLPNRVFDDQRAIYAAYPHQEFLPIKVRVFIDALDAAVRAN